MSFQERKNENIQGKRVVFNSRLALLDPPETPFKGEWPKKPPFWQIYGTSAARKYWMMLGGISVFSFFTMGLTAYIYPKVNLGYIDRYFMPQMFYTEAEREEYIKDLNTGSGIDRIDSSWILRQNDIHIPTRDLRKKADSIEVALEKEKPYIHTRQLPLS